MAEGRMLFLLRQQRDLIVIDVVLKSTECISLFVKISINDPQAIISIHTMKLTVLYTAVMKGAKQLLRKSYVMEPN